jgi:hypothetical protein
MCCIGFAGRAAGYAAKTIEKRGMVCDVLNEGRKLKEGLEKLVRYDKVYKSWDDTPIAIKLAEVNDSSVIPSDKKEKKIIELGKKAGISFSFIN